MTLISPLSICLYFYPRPPGGGRLPPNLVSYFLDKISIHALRVEGDVFLHKRLGRSEYFYPRPPGGGRLQLFRWHASCRRFLSTPSGWRATSQHPLPSKKLTDFYPRPPGGGRHRFNYELDGCDEFLSTPSGWRATCALASLDMSANISIHALRVEGDMQKLCDKMGVEKISIHALRVEGDCA